MTTTRKRTGMHKRQQRQRLGAPRPPDESKVRTPQNATTFWMELGRTELATGFTLRVAAEEDLIAYPLFESAWHKYGRTLAERLPAPFVAGIAPVARQLDEIVSMSTAAEELETQQSPIELVLASAVKFVGARRKAIARISKGAKNRLLRHAFGLSVPVANNIVGEVRGACVALLTGRAAHPNSPAARLLTVGDVKKAKALVAQLGEVQTRLGAQKSSSAEVARARDVLHAALELFYDRFGAAAELAFEDDDATRVALLSLIPRRKDTRAQVKPPVTVPALAPVARAS